MYFDGCSSPLTSLASTLGAPTRESTPQPVPETSTDQARRQRSGSIYRAIVFGANGSVFKVVTVRQKDGTRVSEGVLKARGVAEVSILQRRMQLMCWSCGITATQLPTRYTVVPTSSGDFEILAWTFPTCALSIKCSLDADECLDEIMRATAEHEPGPKEDIDVEESIVVWQRVLARGLVREVHRCVCGEAATDDEGLEYECIACKLVRYCSPKCQTEDWPFHRLSCELHEKYHLADVAPGDPVLSSLNVPFRLSGSDVVALLQLWLRHHHALLVTGLALVPSPPPTAVLHITVSIPRGCQTHALAPYLALEEFPRSLFFPDRRAVVQANEADGETKFRPAFWDLVRSKAARGARGVVVQFGATRVAVWARQDEMDAVREWGKRLGEEGWWELFEWQARCRGCEVEDETFYC